MKKIITPKVSEEAFFYCDSKGESIPGVVRIDVQGNYGSKYDMDYYQFDFCDEVAEEILNFIKSKLQKGDNLDKHLI